MPALLIIVINGTLFQYSIVRGFVNSSLHHLTMQSKANRIVIFQRNENGISTINGIRIFAKMRSDKTSVLTEFKYFKAFLEEETSQFNGWTKSAEFYHNFDGQGFAGIDCFKQSHISVRTFPGIHDIVFDLFISSDFQDYENISTKIFNNLIRFFESEVIFQQVDPNALYFPKSFFKN
jgi:S-adenosylmethionine/arginine decarboxylase-like enzyme